MGIVEISLALPPHHLHVPGPHVLAGVDAEAGDAPADERVHEVHDLPADVLAALVQVVQPHQLAVTNLGDVLHVRKCLGCMDSQCIKVELCFSSNKSNIIRTDNYIDMKYKSYYDLLEDVFTCHTHKGT